MNLTLQISKLKKHGIEKYFGEGIHKKAFDSFDVTIFKVQNSIILTSKVGKLG